MNSNEIRSLVQKNLEINLLQRKRTRELAYARTIYYQLCRELTDLTLIQIGNTLGFTHGTVIHSINKIFPVLEMYNPEYINIYNQIKINNNKMSYKKRFNAIKNENKYLKKKINTLTNNELIRL
jgi:hypothetical protein